MSDYAIVGIGLADCLGSDVDSNWKKYISGSSPIKQIENFDIEEYPIIKIKGVFEIDDTSVDVSEWLSPQEIRHLDRFSIIGFYTAATAIKDAKIEGKQNTAVIYSSLASANKTILECTKSLLAGKRTPPRQALATQRDNISSLISRKFNFLGLNITLTSACSSGINSLDYACKLLESGIYDQVVVGGCDVMVDPMDIYMFQSIGALDTRENPKSCPFDKDRNGFVMGEGSAAFVVKKLNQAVQDGNKILSVIKGIGFSNEAYHETAIEENGIGARMSIDMALKNSRLSVNDIKLVNAHATSTVQGDEIEFNVIKDHFPNVPIQAIKSNIGHTMAACGLVELSYMIKSMQQNKIGPIVNLKNPIGNEINLPVSSFNINADYALKNSFGFGGKCSAIILGKYNV